MNKPMLAKCQIEFAFGAYQIRLYLSMNILHLVHRYRF